jgi:hypothetical protein
MASSRRRALAGAVVVAAVGLAGCGGGGGAADSATASTSTATATSDAPTSESTTTMTAAPTEEEAILAAYQGYWDTWLAANDPPNPDHPDLAKYATGEALERDIEALNAARLERHSIVVPDGGRYRHEPVLVEVVGDTGFVTDCSVDDAWTIDTATGSTLDDAVATRVWNASLVRTAEGWRVADAWVVEQWDGERSCAR